MQILFIDESGYPPLPKDKLPAEDSYFVLGGIVIPEDTWPKVRDGLNLIKDRFSVKGEIKWRYFSPRYTRKDSSLLHLDVPRRNLLRDELYGLITAYRAIKIISVIANVNKAYGEKCKDQSDIYWQSYKQLAERFQYYLQDISKDVGSHINGIIVCDHLQPSDDNRLRDLHQQMISGGQKHSSNYKNLVEGLFFAASHHSVGVQLADIVAGAIYRYAKGDAQFYEKIKANFRKDSKGNISGYGLVKWPKEK